METVIQSPPELDPVPPAPAGEKNNTLAIISLILGILGLLFICLAIVLSVIPFASLVCGGLGILLGVAALVTGLMAYNRIKNAGEQGNLMALAGITMGGIQVVLVLCILPVVAIAILTIMGPAIGDIFSTINASLK